MENTDNDPTLTSLLAMSEYFLHQTPPQAPEAIQCLMATLSLSPPARIEARARLQLGLVLHHHTNNVVQARENLDRAALVAQSATNLQDVSFEASSVSVTILIEQGALHQAKSLLRAKLDASSHHPYWHIKMLLQLSEVFLRERDENAVISTLDRCVDYTEHIKATHTRLLCLLYKGAFLLTHNHYHEASEALNITSKILDGYDSNDGLVHTFYLVVQVTHLLMAGQVKAAKPHLKQLQQKVKVLRPETQPLSDQSDSSQLSPDNFQWLTKKQTFVLVYLVSVMHSVLGGYTEKALGYVEKAMEFMPEPGKDSGVVSVLRAHLLEHTVSCLLMQGKMSSASEKIHEAISVCHGHHQLVYSHRAVLHTLLGLYALGTENVEKAKTQFDTALKHTNENNLRMFISLNLAITYMKSEQHHETDLSALMQSLNADTGSSQSVKAALGYVQGLYMFTQLKLRDAKCHLRESLLLSNRNDLNKLTSCALVILGQIFLALGNTKETLDMATPAMQLAIKIPEKNLQTWAASLLADLYHTCGDYDNENSARGQLADISQEIQLEKSKALKSMHNSLVQWTVGEWPVVQPLKQNVPPINSLPQSSQRANYTPNNPPSSKEGAPMEQDASTSHVEVQPSVSPYKHEMNINQSNKPLGKGNHFGIRSSLPRGDSMAASNRYQTLSTTESNVHDVGSLGSKVNGVLQGSQSPISRHLRSPLVGKTPEIPLIRMSTVTTPTSRVVTHKRHREPPASSQEDPTPATLMDITPFQPNQSAKPARGNRQMDGVEGESNTRTAHPSSVRASQGECDSGRQRASQGERDSGGRNNLRNVPLSPSQIPRQAFDSAQQGFPPSSLNSVMSAHPHISTVASNTAFNPSATYGFNPSATYGFNPSANSGFNPPVNSGFNPHANSGFNPHVNSGFNPQVISGFNLEESSSHVLNQLPASSKPSPHDSPSQNPFPNYKKPSHPDRSSAGQLSLPTSSVFPMAHPLSPYQLNPVRHAESSPQYPHQLTPPTHQLTPPTHQLTPPTHQLTPPTPQQSVTESVKQSGHSPLSAQTHFPLSPHSHSSQVHLSPSPHLSQAHMPHSLSPPHYSHPCQSAHRPTSDSGRLAYPLQRNPQFPQRSSPVPLAHPILPAPSSSLSTLHNSQSTPLSQINSPLKLTHSMPPLSSPSDPSQTMFQQNMRHQQHQQMLQAQAMQLQQHALSVQQNEHHQQHHHQQQHQHQHQQQQQQQTHQQTQQQNDMNRFAYSAYQAPVGVPPGYHQQHVLSSPPRGPTSAHHPAAQFSHIGALQKLGQEPSRSVIGGDSVGSGRVQMPSLHRYGLQPLHSTPPLQLLNGTSFPGGVPNIRYGPPLVHYNQPRR